MATATRDLWLPKFAFTRDLWLPNLGSIGLSFVGGFRLADEVNRRTDSENDIDKLFTWASVVFALEPLNDSAFS